MCICACEMPFFLGQEYRKIKYSGNAPELSGLSSSYCLQTMKARGLKTYPWQHSNFPLSRDPACSSKASSTSHCHQKLLARWRYPHFEIFLYFSLQRHALQINWTGMFMLALGSLWSAEMRRDRYTCVSNASSTCWQMLSFATLRQHHFFHNQDKSSEAAHRTMNIIETQY